MALPYVKLCYAQFTAKLRGELLISPHLKIEDLEVLKVILGILEMYMSV